MDTQCGCESSLCIYKALSNPTSLVEEWGHVEHRRKPSRSSFNEKKSAKWKKVKLENLACLGVGKRNSWESLPAGAETGTGGLVGKPFGQFGAFSGLGPNALWL